MANKPVGEVFSELEDNFAAIEGSYVDDESAGFTFGPVTPPAETQKEMAEQVIEETEFTTVYELAGPSYVPTGNTFAVFEDDKVPKRSKSLIRNVFTID